MSLTLSSGPEFVDEIRNLAFADLRRRLTEFTELLDESDEWPWGFVANEFRKGRIRLEQGKPMRSRTNHLQILADFRNRAFCDGSGPPVFRRRDRVGGDGRGDRGREINWGMPVTIPPRPADTSAEAERVQVDLLRKAPVSRRLQLAWSLSATVIGAARRALARAQPHVSHQEIGLRFVELHYGQDLAAALRADLIRRDGRPASPP